MIPECIYDKNGVAIWKAKDNNDHFLQWDGDGNESITPLHAEELMWEIPAEGTWRVQTAGKELVAVDGKHIFSPDMGYMVSLQKTMGQAELKTYAARLWHVAYEDVTIGRAPFVEVTVPDMQSATAVNKPNWTVVG